MIQSSLRLKILCIILIILVPMASLQFYKINIKYNNRVKVDFRSSENFAKMLSKSFLNYLEEVWTEQYTMGAAIYSNREWKSESIELFMKNILEKHDDVLEYACLDNNGNVIASTNNSLVGKNIGQQEYLNRLNRGEEKVVSNIMQGIKANEIILSVARSISLDDKRVGVIVTLIDAKKLNNIFPSNNIETKSKFGLVDRNGMLAYWNGSNDITFEERKIKPNAPIWKTIINKVKTNDKRIIEADGNRVMGIDYTIEKIGWKCFVTKSEFNVIGKHRNNIFRENIILLITTICSSLFAILLGNHVVRSINKLKVTAESVAMGRFDVKSNIAGNDELAVTSQAFDIMTEKVSELLIEAEEYSKVKSQLYATVSHELKTPLNIILGAVQLMEKSDSYNYESMKNNIERYTGILKQNSYRLVRIINNIIDINKIDGNSLDIKLSNCDIVKVVEDITLSVVEYTKVKNIELIFDTEIEEKIIAFDPDKIERIMLNLLSNAIKFTDEGGSIFVNIHELEDKVTISVKDTGAGIPQNMLQKIFDCFTQADNTLRSHSGGSGIGLSLVKSLVEMHNGTISVKSELGKGSEFIIELPCILVDYSESVCKESFNSNVEIAKIEFSDIYIK